MNVSVIVVSYNTCDHLRACLASVVDQPEVSEVIVVDNASRDGSREMVSTDFPTVRLVRNAQNRGFGAANNQGLELASSSLILLLNSDCVAHPDAIKRLAESFKDPKVVAAGGMLLDANGTQSSCASPLTLWAVFCEQSGLEKFFPTSRWFSPYWETKRLLLTRSKESSPVAQVMGACLMMRPLERFDEEFFLYCEDTELCFRLLKKGQILYVPTAKFEHALGASSAGNRGWSVAMYNRGKELFFQKHFGRRHAMACLILNRWGAKLRLVLGLITFSKRRVSIFWRVLSAPIAGPPLPEDALPRP